jgi:hypothetical protein
MKFLDQITVLMQNPAAVPRHPALRRRRRRRRRAAACHSRAPGDRSQPPSRAAAAAGGGARVCARAGLVAPSTPRRSSDCPTG